MTEQNYDLFISYAKENQPWVEGYLLDTLSAAGVRVHTEEAFTLGAPRLLEFEKAVKQSARTLLVLSPAYLAEHFVQFVDLLAQSYGLETATWPVIPLLLEPVELPTRLAMLTTLDATDPEEWEAAIARLLRTFEQPLPETPPVPECPYPGMIPFSEADSARFFGREAEVQEMLERLRLHPFLTVIGPSGSGKSSLVYAGLLPSLRQSKLFGKGEWNIQTMRPGETPLTTLDTLLPSPAGRGAGGEGRTLLFIDQFEETYTLTGEEAAPFQDTLSNLIRTPNLYIILTFRADFYADLMASPLWAQIQTHRLEVTPLNAGGLRDAIVRPAEQSGVFIESALVERLLADAVGEPGILPLVQETLVLLWEKIERRFLPLRAYTALVLSRQEYGEPPRTGLQVAIARRADATLHNLPPNCQYIARRIFLRLVQFGEGRADTRRQQPVDELRSAKDDPEQFEDALADLANHRLITLSGGEPTASGVSQRRADISHEALITGWPTLQGWLAERREAEQTRRRLEAKAAEWGRLGSGEGGLLDEFELQEAETWLKSGEAAELGGSESLTNLVQASRKSLDTAKKEREAARARELEQAHRLTRTQRQRSVVLGIGLAVAIVLLFVAGWFAVQSTINLNESNVRGTQAAESLANANAAGTQAAENLSTANTAGTQAAENLDIANAASTQAIAQEGIAIEERNNALARQLAIQGITLQDTELDTALLLGIEAMNKKDIFITRSSLLTALEKRPNLKYMLRTHASFVQAITIHPDHEIMASTGCTTPSDINIFDYEFTCPEAEVRFWVVDTGQAVPFPEIRLPGGVNSIAFSPQGDLFAIATADNQVILWDFDTQQETGRIEAPAQTILFANGGASLVVTDHGGGVWVWSLDHFQSANGRLIYDAIGYFLEYPPNTKLALSPDEQSLAVADPFGNLELLTISGDSLGVLEEGLISDNGINLTGLLFSPDGRTLFGFLNTDVWKWDVETMVREQIGSFDTIIASLFFGLDGMLMALSDNGTVSYFDSYGGWSVQAELQTQFDDFSASTAVLPEEALLFTGTCLNGVGYEGYIACEKGLIQAWGLDGPVDRGGSHTIHLSIPGKPTNGRQYLTFSPDERYLYFYDAGSGGLFQVNSVTGEMIEQGRRLLPDTYYGIALSPTGWFATRQTWPAITVFDLFSDDKVELGLDAFQAPDAVAFSPDGNWMAVPSDDTIAVFDANTWEKTDEFLIGFFSNALALSNHGLLAVPRTGGLTLWDVNTAQKIVDVSLPYLEIQSIEFSPDEKTVLFVPTFGYHSVLWDIEMRQEIAKLPTQSYGMIYSPSGTELAFISGTDEITLWDNTFEAWHEQACAIANRNLTQAEWSQYIGSEPYRKTCPQWP